MGWWSDNVMGGDTPLDYLNEIAEICGLHITAGNPYRFNKEILETNLERIALNIQNNKVFEDDNEIAWQVLGHLVIEHDVSLPEAIKGYILASFEWDVLSKKNTKRKNIMDSYIERLSKLTVLT